MDFKGSAESHEELPFSLAKTKALFLVSDVIKLVILLFSEAKDFSFSNLSSSLVFTIMDLSSLPRS